MVIKRLVFAALIFSGAVSADSRTIDAAMMKYYAGMPGEAVDLIRPLAASGDVQAQLLLGNILYSLARSGEGETFDDPVGWYELAAAQNSADANYSLGVIYNNRWIETRSKPDAARAIVYYQNALELGHEEAQLRSTWLQTRSGVTSREARALAVSAAPVSVAALASGKQGAVTETPGESAGAAADTSLPPPVAEPEPAAIAETPPPGNSADSTVGEEPIALLEPGQESAAGPAEFSLDEVAENCRRYTSSGFELYAETIRGGLLIGRATTYSVRPDPSDSERRSIKLTKKAAGIALLLDLDAVPAGVAAGFEQGREYDISGLIIDSVAYGTSCSLSLRYLANSD